MNVLCMHTGSLAHGDLCGAVFTHAHFQKISTISSICKFSLHKQRNAFTNAFFVTNVLSAADLVYAVFARHRKTIRAKDRV